MGGPRTVVIADDLSGALESAAALAGRPDGVCCGAEVLLDARLIDQADAGIVAVDLDSRHDHPTLAVKKLLVTVDKLIGLVDSGTILFKKVDSLWRGNTAREIDALAARLPTVVVPALPALGRTADGTLLRLPGRPTGDLDIAKHLTTPLYPIDLRIVRSSCEELRDTVSAALVKGVLPLLAADSESDLAVIAQAILPLPNVVIAGTGALAHALAPHAGTTGQPHPGPVANHTARPLIFAIGSAEASVRTDAGSLDAVFDTITLGIPPRSGVLQVVRTPAAAGDLDDGEAAIALAAQLAAWAPEADFFATGGTTARALASALGINRLTPLRQVEHGTVISLDSSGRLFATRPGSFGEFGSLAKLSRTMRAMRRLPTERPAP